MPALDAEKHQGPPNAKGLEHGDLLWPKGKGTVIPYFLNDETASTVDEDRLAWEEGQRHFQSAGKPAEMTDAQFDALCRLTYDAFRDIYGEEANLMAGGAGIGLSVGHVAIVDHQQSEPQIIEALKEPGVISRSYKDWAADHSDDLVWQGRFGRPMAGVAESYVKIARDQVGKPYKFWNFDLADDSGFYCSKLVWFAVFRAHGIGVDGNNDPERGIWYSPKQLTRSMYLAMLTPDDPYGET